MVSRPPWSSYGRTDQDGTISYSTRKRYGDRSLFHLTGQRISVQQRIYEDFATLDLISNGRAEIVAGRGSRLGAYELLGFDVSNYEELFEEKLALLLKINEEERVTWQGEFRAPLHHT